ncbi:phosphotransferase enzyme family protein [Planctomycetota bacterium]
MTDISAQRIQDVISQFSLLGTCTNAERFGSGHIHDTFCLTYRHGSEQRRYVLQRINRQVFPDPPAVMENIVRVTRHVRHKLEVLGVPEVERRVLTVVPTRGGAPCYVDRDGEFWRVYRRIEDAETHDVLVSLEQAYHAARGFGEFQRLLLDLPAPPLIETLPRFHDGLTRYQALQVAVDTDSCGRMRRAARDIAFVQGHAELFQVIPRLLQAQSLPLRVTHNDTKINNVMLDSETGESICVLDLDTVMPGVSVYDFGDIVRSSVSAAAEDERDLGQVVAEVSRFDALLRGFLDGIDGFLTSVERDHLVHGSILITLIIGTRFLTDYLNGDRYYKVQREGHNLDRCRAQFKLVESLMEQEEILQSLVRRMA